MSKSIDDSIRLGRKTIVAEGQKLNDAGFKIAGKESASKNAEINVAARDREEERQYDQARPLHLDDQGTQKDPVKAAMAEVDKTIQMKNGKEADPRRRAGESAERNAEEAMERKRTPLVGTMFFKAAEVSVKGVNKLFSDAQIGEHHHGKTLTIHDVSNHEWMGNGLRSGQEGNAYTLQHADAGIVDQQKLYIDRKKEVSIQDELNKEVGQDPTDQQRRIADRQQDKGAELANMATGVALEQEALQSKIKLKSLLGETVDRTFSDNPADKEQVAPKDAKDKEAGNVGKDELGSLKPQPTPTDPEKQRGGLEI